MTSDAVRQLAFELYATGEYSLERLAQTLTDPGYKHEAQTLSGWTDLDGTTGRKYPGSATASASSRTTTRTTPGHLGPGRQGVSS